LSKLNGKREEEGKLFWQLLEQLKFYARFEISDETGDPLDDMQMMQVIVHSNRAGDSASR
jgi:hypothetical protein